MATTAPILYANYQVKISVALEADEKNISFQRSDETTNKVTRTDLEVEESGNLMLAALTSNYPVPMGKVVTGKLLFIETDKEITVKLEGSATAIKLTPSSDSYKARFFMEGSFTVGPTISTATGITPKVAYCIAGLST